MLRKKIGKDAPKVTPPASTTTLPSKAPGAPKIDFTKVGNIKDPINKDKITELVTNKIRQMKKENQIVNKLSTQMQSNPKKKIKQFQGQLLNTLKLRRVNFPPEEAVTAFRNSLRNPSTLQNFKEKQYL